MHIKNVKITPLIGVFRLHTKTDGKQHCETNI